jgi:hypothetical protein
MSPGDWCKRKMTRKVPRTPRLKEPRSPDLALPDGQVPGWSSAWTPCLYSLLLDCRDCYHCCPWVCIGGSVPYPGPGLARPCGCPAPGAGEMTRGGPGGAGEPDCEVGGYAL